MKKNNFISIDKVDDLARKVKILRWCGIWLPIFTSTLIALFIWVSTHNEAAVFVALTVWGLFCLLFLSICDRKASEAEALIDKINGKNTPVVGFGAPSSDPSYEKSVRVFWGTNPPDPDMQYKGISLLWIGAVTSILTSYVLGNSAYIFNLIGNSSILFLLIVISIKVMINKVFNFELGKELPKTASPKIHFLNKLLLRLLLIVVGHGLGFVGITVVRLIITKGNM